MSTKIWHDTYNEDWMRAFPLGNGRVAAMVYGDPQRERIEINEESMWSGKQLEERYDCSEEILKELRNLLFDEVNDKATDLSRNTFLSKPARVRTYESLGEILIDFEDKGEYFDYKKELELRDAVVRVSYNKSGLEYHSESFISEKYDVFAYRMTSCGGSFNCSVTIDRAQDAYTYATHDNTIKLRGRITFKYHPEYGDGGEGISFGSDMILQTDGSLSAEKKSIKVEGATFLTVYSSFATNYNVDKFDIDESIDYEAKLKSDIGAVKDVSFDDMLSEHIKAHREKYETLIFELDAPDFADIPTDVRRKNVQEENVDDNDLFVLYYNFGRYLLLESSGKNATLPANLQGKWCHGFAPPWGSDYHTNINLQMNYWPAEQSNLSDAVEPFVHYVKMLSNFGENTAKKVFGAHGWVVNHTSDIFGRTGVHDSGDCGFFPMAGPWLCLNLFEHYEFTGDMKVLEGIYPILKDSCEFVLDYLTESPDGFLVTSPSNSPENEFYYIDKNGEKKHSMFTYGATIDFEIIYALFTRTAAACKVLEKDIDFAAKLESTIKRLPPLKVSERYGTICEWIKDYEEFEPGHRHISHLFGLYPGDQINENDGEIYQAAKNTIKRRLDNGGAATGWSRAWVINFYARLKDADNAYENLRQLIRISTADNLFDMHPPFQIDGNFGGTAGINEMLLQSHLGRPYERVVELLPALPKEWRNGHICGIKARGNFVFDIYWESGKLTKATVYAPIGGTLRLKNTFGDFSVDKEYENKDCIIKVNLDKGEKAELLFAKQSK